MGGAAADEVAEPAAAPHGAGRADFGAGPAGAGELPLDQRAEQRLAVLRHHLEQQLESYRASLRKVEEADRLLRGKLELPAGYAVAWSGQYEAMQRVRERLWIVVPLTLLLIVLLLYINTRSLVKTAIVLLAVLPAHPKFAMFGRDDRWSLDGDERAQWTSQDTFGLGTATEPAGGINMNFFPLGPLFRRSGVFFIRRTFKDDEVYKLVLHHYIDYLIEKRFTLEWYLEGGRSRSGKRYILSSIDGQ